MGSPGRSTSPGGDSEGKPIGRRVVLGMLGLGALGIVAGRKVQDGVAAVLNPIQRIDPTGLSDLLPGNYFRIYTVTSGYPEESDGRVPALRRRAGGEAAQPDPE